MVVTVENFISRSCSAMLYFVVEGSKKAQSHLPLNNLRVHHALALISTIVATLTYLLCKVPLVYARHILCVISRDDKWYMLRLQQQFCVANSGSQFL